jgi:copper chaperone CopZ
MKIKNTLLILAASIFVMFSIQFVSAADEGAGRTRTTLKVDNLSCGACLARIDTALQEQEGMVGMQASLQQGLVVVEHEQQFRPEGIAELISDMGYPAVVLSSASAGSSDAESPQAKAFRAGDGCSGCSSGGCGATSSSWQRLYERFFSKKSAVEARQ